LAAEHTLAAEIAALAAEDVVLDALELEEVQQVGEDRLLGLARLHVVAS
jgi:hypothetical protein